MTPNSAASAGVSMSRHHSSGISTSCRASARARLASRRRARRCACRHPPTAATAARSRSLRYTPSSGLPDASAGDGDESFARRTWQQLPGRRARAAAAPRVPPTEGRPRVRTVYGALSSIAASPAASDATGPDHRRLAGDAHSRARPRRERHPVSDEHDPARARPPTRAPDRRGSHRRRRAPACRLRRGAIRGRLRDHRVVLDHAEPPCTSSTAAYRSSTRSTSGAGAARSGRSSGIGDTSPPSPAAVS